MKTEQITAIFTNYLNAEETQYALQLHGSWGSGKTSFWKNELSQTAKKAGYKAIYLPLNGISSIAAIEKELFIRILRLTDKEENKRFKAVIKLISNVTNAASKFLVKSSLSDLLTGLSIDVFDLSKYVICFDDLERCRIPLSEILGFINNFVEHKYLKTLILTDETKITQPEGERDYDSIKEKVIGRVMLFELDIERTVPGLYEKYKDEHGDFYDFLQMNNEYLMGMFKEFKVDNLRIIIFYLEILAEAYSSCPAIAGPYSKSVLLFSAIISNEFKKGNLKTTHLNNAQGLDALGIGYFSMNTTNTAGRSGISESSEEIPKSYAEVVYETYLSKRNKQYFFYRSIYYFILSGYLDHQALRKEVSARLAEIQSPEYMSYDRLLTPRFRELTDDNFTSLISRVLQFAKDGKYRIYEYPRIAYFYYYFSSNGLVDLSDSDITKTIYEGLEVAKTTETADDRYLESVLHFKNRNPKVEKIKNDIKDIHNEIKKASFVDEGAKLFDSLKSNDGNQLKSVFEKYKYSGDLLPYIDVNQLFGSLLQIENKQLATLTHLLEERYGKSTSIVDEMKNDLENLGILKNKLDTFLDNGSIQGRVRVFLLKELVAKLRSACERLESIPS